MKAILEGIQRLTHITFVPIRGHNSDLILVTKGTGQVKCWGDHVHIGTLRNLEEERVMSFGRLEGSWGPRNLGFADNWRGRGGERGGGLEGVEVGGFHL